jgi:hypothetical protein
LKLSDIEFLRNRFRAFPDSNSNSNKQWTDATGMQRSPGTAKVVEERNRFHGDEAVNCHDPQPRRGRMSEAVRLETD